MGIYVVTGTFKWKALWVFLIANVLIAMASFCWLRLRMRRSEIGVRRALGSDAGRIVLQQLAEAWLIFGAALVLGLILAVNIIVIGKIDIAAPHGQVLPVLYDSLPLLYDPTVHFLAVAGIVTAVLLAAVTLAALIPLGKALRERTADILKDE